MDSKQYQINMESIARRYPGLAKAVSELRDDGSVKIAKNKKNMPYCIVKGPDGVEWCLHDKEEPQLEGEAFARVEIASSVASANIILIYGLGLGYEFESIFNRYNTPGCQFIVIENNMQLFKKYVEEKIVFMHNPQGQRVGVIFDMPNVHFLVGLTHDDLYNTMFDILHFSSGSVFSTFEIIEHPVLIRFNKPYYKPINEIIARVCYDIRSSFGNDPEDSWLGMDHMLQNTDLICENPGIVTLKDKFKDFPALIVATGPSLNKNIHLINQFKGKAVVFAADASVNTFMKYVNDKGEKEPIIPDIVTSLERSPTTHRHFAQVPEENWELLKDTFLCACPVVRPDVYENWHGKYCIMYRDFSHFHWLGVDKGTLNTGKSVTNLAWKVAEYIGCNPIILAGQDLAFARDGQTHVKGATHASEGLKKSPLIQQRVTIMGYDDQPIESLDTWVGMKKRFEYDIARNPSIVCINATEGGAKIEGTYQMPLQEVLDLLVEERPVKQLLDEYMPIPTKEQADEARATMKRRIDKGYVYMNHGIAKLKNMILLVDDAIKEVNAGRMPLNRYEIFAKNITMDKADLFNDDYCWYAMMHVMQSWIMGRDNVLRACNNLYKGKELIATKLLKLYEMFRGMQMLYEKVFHGTREMYYEHPTKPKALPCLQTTPYERELEKLKA